MENYYEIILYDNGKRKKVFRRYKKYAMAVAYYNKLLKENKVYFPKEYLWTGVKVDYELVLTAPPQNKSMDHFRNEFGAVVKIKTKGFVIKKIEKYEIEDTFKNKLNNKTYEFKGIIKEFTKNNNLTYSLSVINNKLVVERFENDKLDMYVLKNKFIAVKLLNTIKSFNICNGLTNFLYFEDPSFYNKIRIYDILETKYNITRLYIYKLSTH